MKLIFKNNKTMKKILIIICVIFFNMPALLNLFNLTGYNLCSAQKVTSTAVNISMVPMDHLTGQSENQSSKLITEPLTFYHRAFTKHFRK